MLRFTILLRMISLRVVLINIFFTKHFFDLFLYLISIYFSATLLFVFIYLYIMHYQCKIILNIEFLIQYTSANSNTQGTRHFVRICKYSKYRKGKIEIFNTAVEFLALKAIFYKLLK